MATSGSSPPTARGRTRAGAVAVVERDEVVEVVKRRIVEEHQPLRIEPPVLDIPRSERVERERQVPLFEDLPDSPLPPLALLDQAAKEDGVAVVPRHSNSRRG